MKFNKCWVVSIDGYSYKIMLKDYFLFTFLVINGKTRKIFLSPSCQFTEPNTQVCLYKFKFKGYDCTINITTAYKYIYADIYGSQTTIFSDLILNGESVEKPDLR